MSHIKNAWTLAIERLNASWGKILATHLAFIALGFVLFTPLLGLTGRLLLRLSGQDALADQDIAWFLLSPIGLFALVFFAGLLIAILAFEQAVLMRIITGVMQHKHVSTMQALLFTAARANRLLWFALRLVVRVLVIVLPFLAIAAAFAWWLITDYDINFYLMTRPPEFIIAALMIGTVLGVMVVILVRKLLSWSLALPLVLYGEATPAQAFAESERITRHSRSQILGALVAWGGAAFILGVILLSAIRLIGSWTIPAFGESITVLATLLGALAVLLTVGNFFITTFTSGSLASLVMGFYDQFGPGICDTDLDEIPEDNRLKQMQISTPKVTTVLIIAVVVAGIAGYTFIQGIQFNDDVVVVAHRGAAGKAPENTLASIRAAMDDRTDWVEIDVQETADGKVVVIHDSDFMKLAGKDIKVWDATLEQMQAIDVGSWFNPSFSSEHVPTLRQVLDESKGRANVVIELKYYGHDEQLEQRVIDIVEDMDMVEQTAIMSLKYSAVQKMRKLRPDWHVGLLSATAIGDLTQLDADFLAVAMGMASGGFVRRAHEAGKQVFVWTINDPVSMSRMMSLGVDGIITDEPAMARQVLADRKEMSTAERLLLHTALLFGQSFTPKEYRDESP